uniref:Uncharacterized protein n=1 Tax=Rhipicephalus zambeziensis TaxID=60191 RepID=A0A224YH79_9ACAR
MSHKAVNILFKTGAAVKFVSSRSAGVCGKCVFLPAVLSPFHRCSEACVQLSVLSLLCGTTSQLFLNCHFPNEPVRGQHTLTTFPMFGFFCCLSVTPLPHCHCKGEATRLQHVQLFPPPPSAVASRRHLHCTAWSPSLHPSRTGRRPPAKFLGTLRMISCKLKPRNKERITNYRHKEVDSLLREVLQIYLYIKLLNIAKLLSCQLQLSYNNV